MESPFSTVRTDSYLNCQSKIRKGSAAINILYWLIADAVTVVLYSMMVAFAGMEGHIGGEQYVLGFVSFFTISLGGFGIGILCGLLTALITRTTSEVRGALLSFTIVYVNNVCRCIVL